MSISECVYFVTNCIILYTASSKMAKLFIIKWKGTYGFFIDSTVWCLGLCMKVAEGLKNLKLLFFTRSFRKDQIFARWIRGPIKLKSSLRNCNLRHKLFYLNINSDKISFNKRYTIGKILRFYYSSNHWHFLFINFALSFVYFRWGSLLFYLPSDLCFVKIEQQESWNRTGSERDALISVVALYQHSRSLPVSLR